MNLYPFTTLKQIRPKIPKMPETPKIAEIPKDDDAFFKKNYLTI